MNIAASRKFRSAQSRAWTRSIEIARAGNATVDKLTTVGAVRQTGKSLTVNAMLSHAFRQTQAVDILYPAVAKIFRRLQPRFKLPIQHHA